MVAARCSELTLILIASFLSADSGVDGFKGSCPPTAIFHPTKETLDTFEFVDKSDAVFQSENTAWLGENVSFGCLCDFQLCVPLCCPEGYAWAENGCEGDNLTFIITDFYHEKSPKDHHVFIDDSCPASSMDNSLEHDFRLLPNGSIQLETRSEIISLGGYCLLRKPNARKYSAARCTVSNWTYSRICFIVCTSISMFFTLATLVVYTVTPVLKNLQGSIRQCFLISYFAATFMLSAAVNLSLSNDLSSTSLDFFIGLAYLGFVYWFTACFLWMNVMSFDTWKTFRKFGFSREDNGERCRKALYSSSLRKIHYSIYVWGGSAVFILFPILCNMSDFLDPIRELIFVCWATLTFVGIVVSNTCLYISTAILIRLWKKEVANRVTGVDHHHRENEEWFNLNVKLFVVMGGPVIVCAVAFLYSTNDVFHFVLFVIEGLQGVSVFLIFVRKDGVERSFRERFNKIVRKLCCVRRRDTTFTISD